MYKLEKSQLEKSFDINALNENETLKLKEDIRNIYKAIEENEELKEKISKSLEKNAKHKKVFNKILSMLASQNNQLFTEKIDLKVYIFSS